MATMATMTNRARPSSPAHHSVVQDHQNTTEMRQFVHNVGSQLSAQAVQAVHHPALVLPRVYDARPIDRVSFSPPVSPSTSPSPTTSPVTSPATSPMAIMRVIAPPVLRQRRVSTLRNTGEAAMATTIPKRRLAAAHSPGQPLQSDSASPVRPRVLGTEFTLLASQDTSQDISQDTSRRLP
jgi:hypothetical protein